MTWPAAYFYVADMLYRQDDDKSGIETHYQAMRKWIALYAAELYGRQCDHYGPLR